MGVPVLDVGTQTAQMIPVIFTPPIKPWPNCRHKVSLNIIIKNANPIKLLHDVHTLATCSAINSRSSNM
jgi:hypothetical protein